MQTVFWILLGFLLLIVGAILALGTVGVVFMRRVINRMDGIEESMKNIKVEIVE